MRNPDVTPGFHRLSLRVGSQATEGRRFDSIFEVERRRMDKKFKFTKSAVDVLPPAPANTRVEYHDLMVKGLRLRVSSTGGKTYAIYARLKGGGPERVTIGTAARLTPENARTRAKTILADLANGKSHAEGARAKRGETTFASLHADYLRNTPMRPRSLAAYEWLYEKHVAGELGKLKLSEITPDRVRKLHRMVSVGTPITANRCVSMVKAAFNWASKAQEWTGSNPAVNVQKNKETSRTRYLQPAELATFFQSLEECEEPAKSFFMLCLLTGARRSNVLAMRWADIGLDDALWRIPAADAKAGEEMNIPLVPEAVTLLRRLHKEHASPWAFPADSKTGHYQEPKRAWATLRRRAGLADLRIHDLRRTMGSWLVRTGANTAINAKALGHKSMQAAAVYQRIADTDPVREAMVKATTAFLGGGK